MPARIDALFSGAEVNASERRPALHTLLRVPAGKAPAGLASQHAEVLAVRAKCAAFVRDVHEGRLTGAGGMRFTDVVNIGIGGSDLGPAMATAALAPHDAGLLRTHFVSNVDGTQFADLAPALDPARTLVIVCSKTFTTQETLANAHRARAWLSRPPRRGGRSQALRRGLGERRRHGCVRRRPRRALRDVGLGRRALLDVVGSRPRARARDRDRELRGDARGRARHGRAFPRRAVPRQPARDRGPHCALEPERTGLREPRRAAVYASGSRASRRISSSSRWRASASA